MKGDLDGDRDERRRALGYDVFTEAERMVVAGAEATGGPDTLTVARGRFDGERAGSAFLAATRGASATQWRGSALFESPGRAVALVTPRTMAQGDPARRAAIDAAWAIVPTRGGGPLGELRGALDAGPGTRPAGTLALTVSDGMRGARGGRDGGPRRPRRHRRAPRTSAPT